MCTKVFHIVEEVLNGNHWDITHPFNWKRVMLNLPGNKEYDPRLSWVYKVNKEGDITTDLFTYVDDQICTGNTRL